MVTLDAALRDQYLWHAPDLPEVLTDEQVDWIIRNREADRTDDGYWPTFRAIEAGFIQRWPETSGKYVTGVTQTFGNQLIRAAYYRRIGDLFFDDSWPRKT